MTCIAWDGKTLAADKAYEFYDFSARIESKIIKINSTHGLEGWAVGAGTASNVVGFCDWVNSGANLQDYSNYIRSDNGNFSALIISKSGDATLYCNAPHGVKVKAPFALGTGMDFALAAMYLGKTAEEAVQVAAELAVGVSKEYDSVRVIE